MTLEAVFEDLYTHLQRLHEGLTGLYTTIVEDKPLEGDSVLVDVFGDAAAELLGWMDEALAAAGEGRPAVSYPTDLERARQTLSLCQERFLRIIHAFSSDLMRYERIAELMRFGRRRKGEWHAWAGGVKEALERCGEPLYDVNLSLFRCWQEITDYIALDAVSGRTTQLERHGRLPEECKGARGGSP
jgi:hypothetical protein